MFYCISNKNKKSNFNVNVKACNCMFTAIFSELSIYVNNNQIKINMFSRKKKTNVLVNDKAITFLRSVFKTT